MIFKNSLSASWPVHELSSPRLDSVDWPRVGLSSSCPVRRHRKDKKFCSPIWLISLKWSRKVTWIWHFC